MWLTTHPDRQFPVARKTAGSNSAIPNWRSTIGEHPERDKKQNKANKTWLSDKKADALEDPLPVANFLFFTLIELKNGLNILADLVAFGLE